MDTNVLFRISSRCYVAVAAVLLLGSAQTLASEIDFERQIKPILEARCWDCHGEDSQESGLRLDLRAAMLLGGDSGLPAVVPSDAEKSYLIEVINHVDEDMAMPPDEDKLPAAEIELLTQWIESGAIVPGQMQEVERKKSDHWSFQPIKRPHVPLLDSPIAIGTDAARGTAIKPIDAFLLRSLHAKGLSFSPAADPRSLIRRASIVLTGLPPTATETSEFLSAFATSPDQAYAQLVDRLLASEHFGERWAQHWLDVIRWAESNGSESNSYRKNAWIYRDYVIRAFNDDKPYDQFLFDQIAGDTIGQGDATGYLVSGPHVPVATVGKEPTARRQARADRMDEVLQTVGATALGMTIGCARCHNHKFDPISIKDYYSISAVFQGVEFGSRYPELAADHPRQLRGQELIKQIDALRQELRKFGSWEEDWKVYQEIFIPVESTTAVRFKFAGKVTRIDELQIFGTKKWSDNLALASRGTEVECSEEITKASMPIENINDGIFGNDSWIAKIEKGNKATAWVQFNFSQPEKVNRVRLSTNREDVLETDYLLDVGKTQYDITSIEVRTEDGEWKVVVGPTTWEKLEAEHSQRTQLLAEIHDLIQLRNDEGPRSSFVAKFVEPVKTFVLGRGSPENPRDEVFAAGLSELGGDLGLDADARGPERREAFANWATATDNPLTPRVAANRLWHHVFGQGIVPTTSDFGIAGAAPTHPELLDWLAAELMEPTIDPGEPWSMKRLVRMMVMSAAFKQSSLPQAEPLKIDGDAAFLWRFPPKRVEAEVIRDSILQASGLLEDTLGGRSYRIHNVKKRYAQWEVTNNFGPETWRRMIYQERMRRVDDQMFTAFDFPDCGQVRAKRPVSTTPLQALNLMNSDFVIDQSKRIANRAQQEAGEDERKTIDRCFELLLGRSPTDQEQEDCQKVAQANDLSLVCRALINSNEFAFLP